ncbi:hypothetical protein PORCRE_1197 [Porphyromonas crevioricanis JCM 15906]|uniref:Uncharacterized protein n=1 Tax=Porphyromonas crevioricanis JCM 15906 TaxID=1305617 RepID=T1DRZ6_9PORP|nr:hypothetical protein PORCRE_1197 [Porphyromonas crevioricanis JCM 15906]
MVPIPDTQNMRQGEQVRLFAVIVNIQRGYVVYPKYLDKAIERIWIKN